ncbi:MAG: inorganic pyrophosphatase [Pseudodesulfovibrio sp.]|uniref:inorganic pyrophosphatase n=1 Tax=Pseudodesulfovibrio sp. TaxID=2035812 RepID=UPI003D0A08A6
MAPLPSDTLPDPAVSETDPAAFWRAIERIVNDSELVIDRPAGSHHPKYHHVVYPLDYGYLADTSSMDGGGIDVWRGRSGSLEPVAIACTVDLLKKDSEIKILLGCTPQEVETVLRFHNSSKYMKAVAVVRPGTE